MSIFAGERLGDDTIQPITLRWAYAEPVCPGVTSCGHRKPLTVIGEGLWALEAGEIPSSFTDEE